MPVRHATKIPARAATAAERSAATFFLSPTLSSAMPDQNSNHALAAAIAYDNGGHSGVAAHPVSMPLPHKLGSMTRAAAAQARPSIRQGQTIAGALQDPAAGEQLDVLAMWLGLLGLL